MKKWLIILVTLVLLNISACSTISNTPKKTSDVIPQAETNQKKSLVSTGNTDGLISSFTYKNTEFGFSLDLPKIFENTKANIKDYKGPKGIHFTITPADIHQKDTILSLFLMSRPDLEKHFEECSQDSVSDKNNFSCSNFHTDDILWETSQYVIMLWLILDSEPYYTSISDNYRKNGLGIFSPDCTGQHCTHYEYDWNRYLKEHIHILK